MPDGAELALDGRPVAEILSAAHRARAARRRLTVTGLEAGTLEDLFRIAAAGGDSVVFVEAPRTRREAEPPRLVPGALSPKRWFSLRRR